MNKDGYGVFSEGKDIRAHRRAWEAFYGPIPTGMHVLHHCDNPPCVNVNHLFLGTDADNNADMMAKGRYRKPIPWQLSKTECKHGHPLSGNNLYIQPSTGKRYCRICAHERGVRYRARLDVRDIRK